MNDRKHLDLGCGANPRNPYDATLLYGIDILERHSNTNFIYKSANVVLEKIPFSDNEFDSVSAYDFLEHIPRLIYLNGKIIFPFIELMNEIHRVLKPGGKFFAITPVYPKESAFVDPTHVNFVTKNTHKYFTQPHNWASMYGFCGDFIVHRSRIINFAYENANDKFIKKMIKKILIILNPRSKQHIVWEFSAVKQE